MTSPAHPTPLERIRQTERECAQQIATAQDAAEHRLEHARKQAAQHKREAITSGRQQGERDYHRAMEIAQQEAQDIVAQAHERASQLARESETVIDRMVDQALAIIRGGEDL